MKTILNCSPKLSSEIYSFPQKFDLFEPIFNVCTEEPSNTRWRIKDGFFSEIMTSFLKWGLHEANKFHKYGSKTVTDELIYWTSNE